MDFEQICLAKELEKNKLRLHLYEITFPQGCLFPILKYNTESLSSNHLPIDVYPALTPFFDSIVFRRRTALLSLFQTWMQKFICPSRYFYATFIVNFDKNTASAQRDDVKKRCVGRIPEKDYQFPVCAQEILSSRAQRTGHRSSATFSSDRKQTLSLSLSRGDFPLSSYIWQKKYTEKAWKLDGCRVDTCPTEYQQRCNIVRQPNLAAVSRQWKNERRWGARPEQPFTFVS